MVNVFVIGAGGYIGNAVSIAVRRAGHKVWGLVRKSEQAEQLKINEIIPVIGDISDPKTYLPTFDLVSHIIDTTGFGSGAAGAILQDALFSYAEKISSHRKITFVYTTGITTPGKQNDGLILNEDIHRNIDPNRHPLFLNLVNSEEKIIKNNNINGVIVRPGWVFGGTSGHYLDAFWSYDSKTGNYEYKGRDDKIWGWIHVNDLADVYLKVIEAPTATVAHQIFNAVNDSRSKSIDIRTAMAKAAGATGKLIHLPADSDPFSQAMENIWIASNNKAKRLLGWTPKFELLDDVQTYYQAWKAAKNALSSKK